MSGQKVIITPVGGIGGAEQLARQINGNFSKIQHRLNQKQANLILYDHTQSVAKVFIGKAVNGDDLVAISANGVDVIKSLSNKKINSNDFIFHSTLVMDEIARQNQEIASLKSLVAALSARISALESSSDSE